MNFTRQQIKENRLKFANGLLEPHRIKFIGHLENPHNPNERCCLGHGCNIFGINRIVEDDTVYYGVRSSAVAPRELMDLLGLYDNCGVPLVKTPKETDSLASLNDSTKLTTQEIGQLILNRGWIEGGEDTPFKPLSDYPLN